MINLLYNVFSIFSTFKFIVLYYSNLILKKKLIDANALHVAEYSAKYFRIFY